MPFSVPLVVGLLALCFLCYFGVILFRRPRLAFSWHVPAALVIVAWLSLDLLWQVRLLSRLENTWQVFGGLNSQQRMAAAVDGELYLFIQKVKNISGPAPERYFVATRDDYTGIRGAYHLFPANVYRHRKAPELPAREYLRKGDLIVILRPSDIQFGPEGDTMLLEDQRSLAVAPLLLEERGAVFRIL